MNTNYIGVVEDPRPFEQRIKDYKSEELFGGSPIWKEKGGDGWTKPVFVRNQDGSYQCMAYSGAKQLGVNEKIENGEFVNLSPTFIYQKRSNTGGGMWMQNLLDIMVKYGSPKDEWFPCDGLSESQINVAPLPSESVSNEALKYRGESYFQTPAFNIDEIAKAIDIAGSCIIIVRCNAREWTERPFIDPSIRDWADWNVNHGIIALEYGLIDGKKHILIEDSWGSQFGREGQRWLSEEFINKRMFGGGYVIDLRSKVPTEKFYFARDLTRSQMYREDVKNLQKVLILEGCMTVAEAKTGWGYFGNRTHNAVVKLQDKYKPEILTPVGLTKGTGYVGKSTRAFLNAKYA